MEFENYTIQEGDTVSVKNGTAVVKNEDGLPVYSEHVSGYWKKYEYDERNFLSRTVDSKQRTVEYSYNGDGNLLAIESKGYKVEYEYNSLGECCGAKDSEGYWERRVVGKDGKEVFFQTSEHEDAFVDSDALMDLLKDLKKV